jgi:hypothetical protein
MLAQNFKTATDLGISEVELDALIKVLGMLEREELVYTSFHSPTVPNGFNMTVTDHQDECGTVGCIMGWCRFVAGEEVFNIFERGSTRGYPSRLMKGLFMWGRPGRGNVQPAQAAIALRSYLTTGEANWAEALAA